MPQAMRRERQESPRDVRFITFGCYRRLPLLRQAWAKDIVVDHLAHTRSRLGYQLFAYVVMPNHVHLLLHPDVEVAKVPRILSALKTRTSRLILQRLWAERPAVVVRATSERGEPHLWQPGGGYDRNVFSRQEFLEKARYIEDNPVRKGLVLFPEEYAWSSAGSPVLGRDRW